MLDRNLFSEKKHEEYQKIIFANIPEFNGFSHNNYYSLIDYYIESPQKYFKRSEADFLFQFLSSCKKDTKNLSLLFSSLSTNFNELDQAIKLLDEINSKDIHEYTLPDYEVELIYHIGGTFLYEYLKITDSILLGLIKPIASYIRGKNNKGTEKLDIFNCVETLKTQDEFKFLKNYYNHTIRNSIAHAGVTFKNTNIEFKDRKKKLSFTSKEFIKKFDSLIDLVNGLAFAYKKFYLINFELLNKRDFIIPNSIKENELKIKANHNDWNVLYSYESNNQNGLQYNLFIKTTLNSRAFMNLSAYHTASYLEMLFPNKYHTLFLHIKTKFRMPCWQSFDMKKMRAYMNEGVIDNVTDGTFFFDEGFLAKRKDQIKTLKYIFPNVLKEYEKKIFERYTKYHSKKYYNVIENYSICINPLEVVNTKKYIRNNTKSFLKNAIKFKNRNLKVFSKELYLPTKYIRVYIYSNNSRKRTFQMNQVNENLIAILHFNKSKKIRNILPAFGQREDNKYCLIFWSNNHPSLDEQP